MLRFKQYIEESLERNPQSTVKGLRYSIGIIKGVPMQFLVSLDKSPFNDIVDISGGGVPIKDPDRFVKLADKIFGKMNFDLPVGEINNSMLKTLQREFGKHLDMEFGETPAKSFQFVK